MAAAWARTYLKEMESELTFKASLLFSRILIERLPTIAELELGNGKKRNVKMFEPGTYNKVQATTDCALS